MAGALLTLLSGVTVGGAGGSTTLNAVNWATIYDTDQGSNNDQSMLGITTSVSISATLSSGGRLYYNLNGVTTRYAGAFVVHVGDVLSWTVATNGINTGNVAGNVTVTKATTATVISTFAYIVRDGRGL